MKKLLPLLFLLASITSMAQTDNYSGFNYQAVVRDAGGQPLPDQAVGVQFTLGCGVAQPYIETHSTTSDAQGLIALVIGEGTPQGGGIPSFDAIDWDGCGAAPWSISVGMDITGGTNYVAVGVQELKAVPFALNVANSGGGSWIVNGNDLSNTNSGNVGVGTTAPARKLHLAVTGSSGLLVTTPTTGSLISDGLAVGVNQNAGNQAYVWNQENTELVFGTNATERLRIDPIGNVGIGTTSPTKKLEVNGTAQVTGPLFLGGYTNNGDYGELQIKENYTNDNLRIYGSGDNEWTVTTAGTGNDAYLNFDAIGTFWTSFDGNVGIRSAPQNQRALYVNGKTQLTGECYFPNTVIDATGIQLQGTLEVDGKIWAREVEVTLAAFPDYVFDEDYDLMALEDVAAFIEANGHLPNVPSACDVEENGIGLGEMNRILLEKVEELTLHAIEKEKEIDALASDMDQLRTMLINITANSKP